MIVVALKIKRLRISNGITQNEMAERVHLSLKAWQKIENGKTKLDLDRLNQIAGILGISLIELISLEEKNDLEKSERLLLKIIDDKNEEITFLRTLLQDNAKDKYKLH
jgi:transcriptional regulator with XRE-family HTH domain